MITDKDKQVLKEFGAKVKDIREDKNYTQEAFADKAGIERSYMGKIERGESNPTLLKVHKIAKAFKVHSSKLLSF